MTQLKTLSLGRSVNLAVPIPPTIRVDIDVRLFVGIHCLIVISARLCIRALTQLNVHRPRQPY
jgi:hypothetical protein